MVCDNFIKQYYIQFLTHPPGTPWEPEPGPTGPGLKDFMELDGLLMAEPRYPQAEGPRSTEEGIFQNGRLGQVP